MQAGAVALLDACGGGAGPAAPVTPPVPPPPAQFKVGGTVTGLRGTGLQLLNNGDNPTPISASGAFAFSRTAVTGAAYAVTISAQPTTPTQTCTVARGAGTVGTADVSDIAIACTDSVKPTSLRFVAKNPHEAWLLVDVDDALRNSRVEVLVNGVVNWCCSLRNGDANTTAQIGEAAPHPYFLGAELSPYARESNVFEVRVKDANGTIVSSAQVTGGTRMPNSLLNGGATSEAISGWKIEGDTAVLKRYNESSSALYRFGSSPFETLTEGIGVGSYFSTEGTPGGFAVLKQRVTVAFPGVTDASSAVSIGGWFGNRGGGKARMEIAFVGENPDGTPFTITGAALGVTSTTTTLNRDFTYGQVPRGIHYIDITVTLDGRGGSAAFADNLWVSTMTWPH
jgi:hypothetical protein